MSFHPFTALAVLLVHTELSASQTDQPRALRANTSLRELEVQAHSCWLLVTVQVSLVLTYRSKMSRQV